MLKLEVPNLGKFIAKVDREIGRSRRHDNVKGSVGYSAPYALVQHEDLTFEHPVGQAKYLEQPMRTDRAQIRAIIYAARKRGATQREAIRQGLQHLKELSQRLVPVDTGHLRSTAFVEVELS